MYRPNRPYAQLDRTCAGSSQSATKAEKARNTRAVASQRSVLRFSSGLKGDFRQRARGRKWSENLDKAGKRVLVGIRFDTQASAAACITPPHSLPSPELF